MIVAAAVVPSAAFFSALLCKRLYCVPLSFFSIAMLIRILVMGALCGLVSSFIATRIQVEFVYQLLIALFLAITSCFLLFRQNAKKRGLVLALVRINEESIREEAVTAMLRIIDRAKESSETESAELALLASSVLQDPAIRKKLRKRLKALRQANTEFQPAIVQVVASMQIENGEYEEARRTFQDFLGPEGMSQQRAESLSFWVVATFALLEVCQGSADQVSLIFEVLKEKAKADRSQGRDLRQATLQVIKAHLAAAASDFKSAKQDLVLAHEIMGESALKQACTPPGPASSLAKKLMAPRKSVGAAG